MPSTIGDRPSTVRHRGSAVALLGSVIAACGAVALLAQQPPNSPNDWPTYGHDAGSTRFSAQRQITTANAGQLKLAWTYHLAAGTTPAAPAGRGAGAAAAAAQGDAPAPAPAPARGGRGAGGFRASEATPIVVNGVMFLPTPYGRVIALRADTGQEVWVYNTEGGAPTNRGVEYWPGDGQNRPRIILSIGDRLAALDAATGTRVTTFGTDGFVNMREGIENGFTTGQLSLSSPPKVYKNLIIAGARVQEAPSLGYAGDTRAWDVRTGKLVWQFHSVPRPGEPGSETWQGEDWKNRSGLNVWGFISVDPVLGLVYLPYGSASYDFYGGDRKGANLFANSIVALEAETGKLKWHFQAVPHDTWDYDFAAAPVLFEITRNGQRIPALAEVSKQGLVYILDRRDGKPIFGMEERAVPPSDVPGEDNSFKVPFPVKPAPVARMSFTAAEIAKVTPEHEKFCTDLMASDGGMRNNGPFTRYGTTASIVFPGTLGASNWHGASVDPGLGLLFMNVIHLADTGKVTKNADGARQPYSRNGFNRFWNSANYWPCQAPPWGEMLALNVNTGDVAWKVPFGIIEELEARGIRNTGTMNMGGSIATAGGLVFIAATNDRHFRAFDSRTGKVVWDTVLPAGAYATPITYQANGKQYVSVVAAGGGYYDRVTGDSLVAYALP